MIDLSFSFLSCVVVGTVCPELAAGIVKTRMQKIPSVVRRRNMH